MAGRGGRNPGAGRPKGSSNKITADLREMILTALDAAGGVEYLTARALDAPGPFLALVAKILPKEIHAEVRPNFQDMTDAELDAFMEDTMREIGWVPGPNARRLVEQQT